MFVTPQSEYNQFMEANSFLNLNECKQSTYDLLVSEVSHFRRSNMFEGLAKELLLTVLLPSRNNTFTYNIPNHQLGFVYQRNYTGLMATKKVEKNKTKRGLFDIKVQVDSTPNKTHYMVFSDLLKNSALSKCVNVWTGFYPLTLTSDVDERFALEELTLMMFEQEVNWGDEDFQAYSAFSLSKRAKPRDVLMGFTNIVFTNRKVDSIPNWQYDYNKNKSTPDFGGAYGDFDITLKNTYFTPYRSNAGALMQGAIRELFLKVAKLFINNPKYK
ncbi:hypothetical protein IFT92_21840 [Peribacillus simplex]|uniref:hypothetical protein n=1 Tax=Peribacillus simplex TaxID=1478 RepID=UPI001923B006|nr:hypothetical protein [Peribacillus simplex]MBD8590395.1 hypothetical protein [Peribacillus simplex]